MAGTGKEGSHGLPHPRPGLGGPALVIDRNAVRSGPVCFCTGENKITVRAYSSVQDLHRAVKYFRYEEVIIVLHYKIVRSVVFKTRKRFVCFKNI